MEKKAVIKFHVIFWIVASSISLFDTYIYTGDKLSASRFISVSLRILFNIITFYLFYLIVTPQIFNKKKIIFLALLEITYLVIFGYIFTFISYYPFARVVSASNPIEYTLANGINDRIFATIAILTIFSILGTLSKISLIWYNSQVKQKETEKQNISNELAMLKAQINPHFLFNTLNNIKSLIKSLPSKASYSIDKLTDIMHYMLYDSSNQAVPLINEVKHINNYLELEKIRYSDPDFIDFKISGEYSDILIPPLIFMPFIENAFKHGNKLKPPPGIVIKIDVCEKNIHFEVRNFIKENYEMQNKNSGFGLSNIRRRLDLLFDDKYELIITNENKSFFVNLNLNIA